MSARRDVDLREVERHIDERNHRLDGTDDIRVFHNQSRRIDLEELQTEHNAVLLVAEKLEILGIVARQHDVNRLIGGRGIRELHNELRALTHVLQVELNALIDVRIHVVEGAGPLQQVGSPVDVAASEARNPIAQAFEESHEVAELHPEQTVVKIRVIRASLIIWTQFLRRTNAQFTLESPASSAVGLDTRTSLSTIPLPTGFAAESAGFPPLLPATSHQLPDCLRDTRSSSAHSRFPAHPAWLLGYP